MTIVNNLSQSLINMKFNITITRLSSWTFMALCASVLLWQLTTVINKYFRYKVTTSTHVFTPDVIKPYAMTACVNDGVDFKQMNRDLNTTYKSGRLTGLIGLPNVSVRKWFDYTPSNETVLGGIWYKSKEQSEPIHVSKNVRDHVDILKFFTKTFVCYKMVVKKSQQLSYRDISVSNFNEFQVNKLVFNTSTENATSIKFMISPINHLPNKELIGTTYIPRDLKEDNGTVIADTNWYISNHMTIDKEALPSPYETNCINYKNLGFHGRDHCIDECVSSRVWTTFRKVSFMSPVTEPSDAFPFTRVSLQDQEVFAKFSKIQDDCQVNQCRNRGCNDAQIVTTTVSKSYGDDRQFSWDHKAVSQISFRITSSASLSFVEFIIYILGSISTWTGLSIVACNPVKLANRMRMTLKSRPHYRKRNPIEIESQILSKVRRMLDAHQTRLHFMTYYTTQQQRKRQQIH